MIQVEMLSDIRTFEPKFFGPFTKRQTISLALAIPIAIPVFLVIPSDVATKAITACVFAGPVAMCGWIKVYGIHMEIFAIRYFYQKIMTPTKRKYKTNSTLKDLILKTRKKEEQEYVNSLSKKEKKLYQKQNGAKKVIYSKDEYYLPYN